MILQLSIYIKHPDARAISHLLAKNPDNIYERNEKGHLVRFVYHTMTDTELDATFFVTPDPLALVQHEKAYDITHYINDRAHAVSTIFLSFIRKAIGTALNGKPKEAYARYVAIPYPFTFEIGPVATALSDEEIRALWEPLGYSIAIEAISEQQRARFLKLTGETTLQKALQQLFVLIPVMDDYKHFFIDEAEKERIERYGKGWLDTHPLKAFILKKALRFRHLLDEPQTPKATQSLNTIRYEAIVQEVKSLPHATIVDLGSGEGKLSERLAMLDGVQELLAVEPSITANRLATKRFEDLEVATVPRIHWGSLFYYDPELVGKDILILCEVIEHIDAERLKKVMHTIFKLYTPKSVIMTTPNAEFNAVYAIDLRHDDHRFEWTRAEFEAWCKQMTDDTPYFLTFKGIGDIHPIYGTPTQMCIARRLD